MVTTHSDRAATPASLTALKARQRAAWATGDYAVVGTTLAPVGEALCDAVEIAAGERVLDVACGSGNTALSAARRAADVVAIDYVPSLVEVTRRRAAADRLDVDCREGDAEALRFAEGSFDAVLSVFGAMFAAHADLAAAELLRVCRAGGRIGLASWTPDGFVGRMFDVIAAHVPPPPAAPSPLQWGTAAPLARWFGAAGEIANRRRTFLFRYRSVEHWFDVFSEHYGPLHTVLAALGPRAPALRADLLALARDWDVGDGRGIAIRADYLETVVRVRGPLTRDRARG
jgi:SAM-dependent methyltransferase